MENSELSETGQHFMIQLFEQTRGDQSAQVSMYDIGGILGLDRDNAARVAEELIGLQMVEIKTLSGGIGISTAGSEMVQDLVGPMPPAAGDSARLGDERLLNSTGRRAVDQIVTEIKDQTGALGLDFDTLTELMADLKSIDAQLASSRPKTAIVGECLRSISGVLKSASHSAMLDRINTLLDE
jgi:hypothetical protein